MGIEAIRCEQLNSFLVMGAWGFLHGNIFRKKKQKKCKSIEELIDSEIFQKKALITK